MPTTHMGARGDGVQAHGRFHSAATSNGPKFSRARETDALTVGCRGLVADVFFAFPHIAVSETGSIGDLVRVGRDKISQACGALVAIKGIAARGETLPEDPEDDELVKLTSKVLAHVSGFGTAQVKDCTNA